MPDSGALELGCWNLGTSSACVSLGKLLLLWGWGQDDFFTCFPSSFRGLKVPKQSVHCLPLSKRLGYHSLLLSSQDLLGVGRVGRKVYPFDTPASRGKGRCVWNYPVQTTSGSSCEFQSKRNLGGSSLWWECSWAPTAGKKLSFTPEGRGVLHYQAFPQFRQLWAPDIVGMMSLYIVWRCVSIYLIVNSILPES